jgi:methionine-rich copper-binding protein CopC
VAQGKASVDPANARHLSVMLQPLAPGVYTVSWVAIAVDSHRTQGHYQFTVK